MNINDYISSGIVESYVLGLASAEERAEFEKLCIEYPELIFARNSFEMALEKQAFENAPQPLPAGREKFVDFINRVVPADTGVAKVVPMPNKSSRSSGVRFLAAASIILLIVSAYFAYTFYNENAVLKSELQNTKDAQAKMDARLRDMEEQQRIIKDPRVSVVNLTGLPKAPASSASVYWDSTSSNVWLIVKNLPQLPTEKQYQLWALIGGKPKDLGLFDSPNGDGKVMLKMYNTQKADAFAITVEKRGNGSVPNGEIETMGKAKL